MLARLSAPHYLPNHSSDISLESSFYSFNSTWKYHYIARMVITRVSNSRPSGREIKLIVGECNVWAIPILQYDVLIATENPTTSTTSVVISNRTPAACNASSYWSNSRTKVKVTRARNCSTEQFAILISITRSAVIDRRPHVTAATRPLLFLQLQLQSTMRDTLAEYSAERSLVFYRQTIENLSLIVKTELVQYNCEAFWWRLSKLVVKNEYDHLTAYRRMFCDLVVSSGLYRLSRD